MMTISAIAEERAKDKKLYLFWLRLDGKYVGMGNQEWSGALPTECVDELLSMIRRWTIKRIKYKGWFGKAAMPS